ncbi:hypothetical protein [Streptomyces sp. NPDC058486]|uniref:hypothetical protein n=1 Tax=unclassified Streptomyces TaxID=2593676 RepID=UPI00364CDCE5
MLDATAVEIAADAVVPLVEHARFALAMIEKHAPYALDRRNHLSGPTVEAL